MFVRDVPTSILLIVDKVILKQLVLSIAFTFQPPCPCQNVSLFCCCNEDPLIVQHPTTLYTISVLMVSFSSKQRTEIFMQPPQYHQQLSFKEQIYAPA